MSTTSWKTKNRGNFNQYWCYENNGFVRSCVQAASMRAALRIAKEAFDTKAYSFNVLNGTIDLSTGKLGPHSKADYISKLCPYNYDESAKCSLFQDGLTRVFESKDMRDFLQRALGYSLLGNNEAKMGFIMYSSKPDAGKSGIINPVLEIVGRDYFRPISWRALAETGRGASTESWIFDLMPYHIGYCAEPPKGIKLDTERLKLLVGGDLASFDKKYGDPATFRPKITPWLSTNYRPKVDGDDAFWSKIMLIDFGEPLTVENRIPLFMERVVAEEAEGLLAFLVDGCKQYFARKRETTDPLGAPDWVKMKTEEYKQLEDSIGQFVKTCVAKGEKVLRDKLYTEYCDFCQQNGLNAVSKVAFGEKLRDLFPELTDKRHYQNVVGDRKQQWFWIGIDLAA